MPTSTEYATGDADSALSAVIGGLRPSLVFADVIMPGSMSGIELADRLHALQPRLPVVLILSKPYRKDDLAHALRQAFNANGAEGGS